MFPEWVRILVMHPLQRLTFEGKVILISWPANVI